MGQSPSRTAYEEPPTCMLHPTHILSINDPSLACVCAVPLTLAVPAPLKLLDPSSAALGEDGKLYKIEVKRT